MKKTIITTAAGLALMGATACTSSNGQASPDEFRVITKAPLIVPPDYQLRPPAAGQSLPSEVQVERTDAATAFGTTIGKDASSSEKALVAAADANAVSSVIRAQIDYEEAATIRKNKSVVDRVLFWRDDNPEDVADAAIDSATGDAEVTIERAGGSSRLKLPGT